MNSANLVNGKPMRVTTGICACGTQFLKKSANRRWCGDPCRLRAHNESAKAKHPARASQMVTTTCEECEQSFTRTVYEGESPPKFCSKRCSANDYHKQRRADLATAKARFEPCKSCGLDLRLIRCGELSCWLRECPPRTVPVSEAELATYARQLACAGLTSSEQNEASVDVEIVP
jgi:hypothetical protein